MNSNTLLAGLLLVGAIIFIFEEELTAIKEKSQQNFHEVPEDAAKLENSDSDVTVRTDIVRKFESEGKYGLVDSSGIVIVSPKYEKITQFYEGELAIVTYNYEENGVTKQRQGLVNKKGEEVVTPNKFNIKYIPEIKLFKISHHHYRENKQLTSLYSIDEGLLDDAVFQKIEKFNDGFAVVYENGKYGLIDSKGKIILPTVYKRVFEPSDGLITAWTEDETLFFNLDGSIAIPAMAHLAMPFKHGVSVARSKWSSSSRSYNALMDKTGKLLTDYIFNKVEFFQHSEDSPVLAFTSVKREVHTGVIDLKGNWVIEPQFRDIELDRDGFYKVTHFFFLKDEDRMTKRFKYIADQEGKLYAEIGVKNPSEEKPEAIGLIGIIDSSRNIIAEPIYDDVRPFSHDLITIKKNGRWGVVNNRNEVVVEPIFDRLEIPFNDLAFVLKGKHWGVYDFKKARLVTEAKYEEIKPVSSKVMKGKVGGKWESISL